MSASKLPGMAVSNSPQNTGVDGQSHPAGVAELSKRQRQETRGIAKRHVIPVELSHWARGEQISSVQSHVQAYKLLDHTVAVARL